MQSYLILLLSPICWASWLNFKLLCVNWRFESFYINYACSIVLFTLVYGSWSAGSVGAFLYVLFSLHWLAIAEGIIAGVIWGIGNILLVAAIVLCGLAVGLKMAIGLSLLLGVILTYAVNPAATNNPWFLACGVLIVAAAVFTNGKAYKVREEAGDTRFAHIRKGLVVAVVCGILIGIFPFFQGLAIKEGIDGPQAAFLLSVGDLLVAVPLLAYLMRHPLIPKDEPARLFVDYMHAKPIWHVWAILSGLVWSIGTIANLVVAVQDVGLSIAWAVGECSPLVGLLWGLFVFKEFTLDDKNMQQKAWRLLALTVVLYMAGIVLLFFAA